MGVVGIAQEYVRSSRSHIQVERGHRNVLAMVACLHAVGRMLFVHRSLPLLQMRLWPCLAGAALCSANCNNPLQAHAPLYWVK
jgi:hypothetical protein